MIKDNDQKEFISKLQDYQELISSDISQYAQQMRQLTKQQYSEATFAETDAYLQILERGGKRIRGALTMVGYEMCGGKSPSDIVQVARAVEMAHAYYLVIDDIQDKSAIRRGADSAHKILEQYHKQHKLRGDAPHFGVSIAINSALAGIHAAQMILANTSFDQGNLLKTISIFNRTLGITAHGQTQDIINSAVISPSEQDIDDVLTWKTAYYTILNPLHMGMVLAGADCHSTDAITDYAVAVGKAFQITDDIIGIFGSKEVAGKSPKDDLREGKQTLLTVHALKHASGKDRKFLLQTLGSKNITDEALISCQEIVLSSGARAHAESLAQDYVNNALASLNKNQNRWTSDSIVFLRGLAEHIPNRTK